MHNLRTLAIKINDDTHAIAVACLPPDFAMLPFDVVRGNILIINDVTVSSAEPRNSGGSRILKLTNAHMRPEVFYELFGGLTGVNDSKFVEVHR